ncbi:Protein of unknown function [Saccharopolyspora kobensis]|uniref:DUF4232 domain-containing protein n=1 Tax=Saccharopolyspora kobensis TaxID=146035 RepID=A0A1H6DEQ8_9PSEU|nr:DUF4232 domain-containing protein [Saccharopolyspora kobensis]SEG83917.1 Protein of unknown function [Saccharopolyspora kobensis]SFE34581.1 Protein of unknown function [Saccharopolyspora kobensis]
MRAHTIGKTLLAATVCVVSLSACGNLSASEEDGRTGSASLIADDGSASCTTEQLEPTFVLATTGKVAGHVSVANTGSEPCVLDASHPIIQFNNRDALPIDGVTYRQGNPGSGPITLAPGESAAAELDWNDMGPECVARVWGMSLSVRPEDQPKSVDPLLNDKPWVFDLCGDEVTVHGWQKV